MSFEQFSSFLADAVILKEEEERDLIKKYRLQGCMKSRDLLLQSFMKYIIKMAKNHRRKTRSNISMDDLISEGCLGFIRSLDKFDLAFLEPDHPKKIRLVTYSFYWITDSLNNYTNNNTGVVRVITGKRRLILQKVNRYVRDNYENFAHGQITPKDIVDISESIECDYADVEFVARYSSLLIYSNEDYRIANGFDKSGSGFKGGMDRSGAQDPIMMIPTSGDVDTLKYIDGNTISRMIKGFGSTLSGVEDQVFRELYSEDFESGAKSSKKLDMSVWTFINHRNRIHDKLKAYMTGRGVDRTVLDVFSDSNRY